MSRSTSRMCGAVGLALAGEPAVQVYCHCESCRGWLGAPVHAEGRELARRTGTSPRTLDSSPLRGRVSGRAWRFPGRRRRCGDGSSEFVAGLSLRSIAFAP